MKILVKRKLNIAGLVFLGLIFILGLIRLISGEDDWICQNGEWVKHGMPSAPKPTTPCPGVKPTPNQQLFKVIRVFDGDTMEIEG